MKPHYPAKPDKFEFDDSVAEIFDDMARRSIPLYEEAHYANAKLCSPLVGEARRTARPLTVLDIGASRGGFLRELKDLYPDDFDSFYVRAVDSSAPMVERLSKEYPGVQAEVMDVLSSQFRDDTNVYDIVNCSYVIQFLPPDSQVTFLFKLATLIKPRGLLFIGQKLELECGNRAVQQGMENHYYDFRHHNGYSREEIEAKTKALKGSMWPMSDRLTQHYLRNAGLEVQETYRWMMFNNLVCYRKV